MDKLATENIFLLEFLVDEINLSCDVRNNLRYFLGDICVLFQFLDNAPFYIDIKNFSPQKCQPCDPNMVNKNGKSCLFAMTPKEAENAFKKFNINVEIFKHQSDDYNNKLPIGATKVPVVELFRGLVKEIIEGNTMITKTLKTYFKLKNDNGKLVGDISALVRLTCFGKLIITHFQLNLGEKSVDMKTKEGDLKLKFNKSQVRESSKCNLVNTCPYSIADREKNNLETWTYSEHKPCPGYIPTIPAISQKPKKQTPALCDQEPKFADVCATLNNQNPVLQAMSNSSEHSTRLSCGDPSCEYCYTPPPPCFCNETPQVSSTPVNNVVPIQQLSMRTNCKGKEVPFTISMPKDMKSINIVPPTCTAPDGSKFTEISDPKKEMFVLRIKKKSEGEPYPKNSIDLELNTPAPTPPPAEMENRRSQYVMEDLSNEYLEKYYGKQLYAMIKKGLNPLSKVAKGL